MTPLSQSYSDLRLISKVDSDRFWRKVTKGDACWTWDSAITRNGYGLFRLNGKSAYAHRISYLAHNGTISQTLVIDHLCRNRLCVNPAHLREITRGENVRIGINHNALKTICPYGHEFDRVGKQKNGRSFRICSECHNQVNREHRIRVRARMVMEGTAINEVLEALR